MQCPSLLRLCAFSQRRLQPLASNFLRNALLSAKRVGETGLRRWRETFCEPILTVLCDLETRIATELKPPRHSLPDVRLPRTHTESFSPQTHPGDESAVPLGIHPKQERDDRPGDLRVRRCRDLQQPRGAPPTHTKWCPAAPGPRSSRIFSHVGGGWPALTMASVVRGPEPPSVN